MYRELFKKELLDTFFSFGLKNTRSDDLNYLNNSILNYEVHESYVKLRLINFQLTLSELKKYISYYLLIAMTYDEEKIKVPRFNEASGFYTTKKRSKIMSKIRGKNTKPELLFRKALWRKGVRYRVDSKQLPGKPDVSIKKYKLAIFIDGEFWHGYNWDERKSKIKTNRRFWIPKIERNMQRDKEVNQQLKDMDYTVFRFWTHEIKDNLKTCINDVMMYLHTAGIRTRY